MAMCPIHHHNLMIVTMWVNLRRTENIPNLLTMTIPLTLTAHLLPIQKPMAVRMKGKEKTKPQHSKKDNPHSQTASHLRAMEATIRSLVATTTLIATKVTSDSLEGLGLRTATCTAHPSQGKFDDTGCKASRNALLNLDGNFAVKRPAFLEGLFEKSFCSTKQVSLFCPPKSFSGYSQARRPCPSF